jgi:Flp pilus assembly protein TadG
MHKDASVSAQHGRNRCLRRGQSGQSLAEFALMLPILMMICLGVLDLGRCFFTYISLTNAAREAARYAALNGSASCTQVYKEFGGTACNTGTQTVSGCVNGTLSASGSGSGTGNPYTVTVSCDFQLLTPFMG